jgi:hypothetical protein
MKDDLYQEYRQLCIERGVFPVGKTQLEHNTEERWMNLLMAVIRGYPSRTETGGSIEPDEPFKSPGG